MEVVILTGLIYLGYQALTNTKMSLERETATNVCMDVGSVKGYGDIANEVPNPANYTGDPFKLPVKRTEMGPFGVPRNLLTQYEGPGFVTPADGPKSGLPYNF